MDKSKKTEYTFSIKVSKDDLQEKIEELKQKGLFNNSFEILKEQQFAWIPINEELEGAEKKAMRKKNKHQKLKERFGIRAFEIIGNVIVLFLPRRLMREKEEVGKYLLNIYPKIKAVYIEKGKTKGKYRIQEKELIAGEGSETIHKENNLKFKLDINKVYFSARQSSERLRLREYTSQGDNVCVFFSGIGAIPIYLAKYSQVKTITAIEINEEAHKYAIENLEINEIKNVQLILGDVNNEIPKLSKDERFDLIIMPLPKNALSYIKLVNKAITEQGRLVIIIIGNKQKIIQQIIKLEKEEFKIINIRKERSTGPKEWRYTIYARKDRKLN